MFSITLIIGLCKILKVDYIWNGVHPTSRGQLGSLLKGKVANRIKKSTLTDLTENNANQIIPLHCRTPVI